MKIVCGKCSAEVELPRAGQSPKVECPSCGAVFRVPSLAEGEEFPHPDTFPGYRIRAIVGHGGMGTVYRAVQLSMDREVAIKVLLRKYADVPRFVARFEREAAALAALSHPNIVAVIDRGRQDDMYFFVMEFVHGHTLRRSIRRGEVGVERAVEIAVQICDALEAAHERGIVHRDIKPGNILIQEDGLVKVADFGIVHMIDDEAAAELERRSRLGTAKYMAPEQRGTGQGIDPRADIYGLGVTLYEALTGALPEGQPPSALNPEVPEELDRVIERALQDEPDRRFQTADEMRRALQRALDDLRAARASQAPPLPTVSCPQCGAAVAHGALACPACAHRLLEPCYRPDCPGTNPPGAERCAQCGGRLDVLREQRREELENRLRRGELLLAHGRGAEAAEEFRIVEADPHEAFQPLRHEAGEQLRELGRRSARRLARAAAIALVVAAAGVGGYLGVRRSLPLPPSKSPDERSGRRARDRDEERPGQGASRKPRPRDAFVDYLLALTSEGWGRHGPARRVLAASHAAACLADRGEDGEAARRLAATLEALGAGQEPRGDGQPLEARLLAAVEALARTLAADLRRREPLAPRVREAERRYAQARRAAQDPAQRLDAGAGFLYDLAVVAATGSGREVELPARLLLLGGALAPMVGSPGMARVADRLHRAGELVVRALRRTERGVALPEFLDDARRRLERASGHSDPAARLAATLEAMVEALGTRRPPHSTGLTPRHGAAMMPAGDTN